MLPHKSVDSQGTAGPGTTRDLEDTFLHHSMQVDSTGVGDGERGTVMLQGSLNGYEWFSMGTVGSADYDTDMGGVINASELARYVRANVTYLDTMDSPSINAWVASAP